MENKDRLVRIDGYPCKDFTFEMGVACDIGLHASLAVSTLLLLNAYMGPGGKKWVELTGWDWANELQCLSEEEVLKAVRKAVEQKYILIAEKHKPLLYNEDWEFYFMEWDAEYLLNPVRVSVGLSQKRQDRKGYVYLYQMPGKCKLGKSAELDLRLKQLCKKFPPAPLVWMYTQTNDRHVIERAFQIMFASKDLGDELYDLSPLDIAYFAYQASSPLLLPPDISAHLERLKAPFSIELADYETRLAEAIELAWPKSLKT